MKVVFDAMPAPVIKTGNIPTALAAVVRLVYLAQKGPDTPARRGEASGMFFSMHNQKISGCFTPFMRISAKN
jgi:hypothetical protein